MKSYHLLCFMLLLFSLGCLQCSRCESGKTSETDEPAGSAIADGSVKNGSTAMEWEQLSLGISQDEFRTKVAQLFSQPVKAIDSLFECGAQQGVWLIRPLKNSVLEHQSPKPLQFCAISAMRVQSSLRVSSIRGDFLDNKLFAVQLKFRTVHFDALQSELSSRFGEGESRKLAVHSVVGESKAQFRLWKVDGVVWSLSKNKNEAALQMQPASLPPQLTLIPAADTAPSDLSDIGLNGSPYDVKLDDLKVPDALLEKDTAAETNSDTDAK
ncbi:MAG: hypothetical protein JXX29_09060 [Deltaproteobacteria bacterium]|nr:hypothetical protein [Deltaproteobacteria bacterium]MBN2671811.1 hypothetical protein [Deltaproteobacteria bacterium]